MKVMSPLLYSRRNKRKVFAAINSVMIAVSFLYILYAFVNSITYMQERNSIYKYENASIVTSYGKNIIDTAVIDRISKNENVDRLIPTSINYGIKYVIPGISDQTSTLPIREFDMEYFMNKEGIKLINGRLPKDGVFEIAINKDIAINRKVTIGDKVGDSINKFDSLQGEYVIVGIIESKALISILSVNESLYQNYKNEENLFCRGFIVYPKDGKKQAMDKFLTDFKSDETRIINIDTQIEAFKNTTGVLKVLDIIAILSIIVMVITVGSSKYAQYLNRKEELGIINAIGYSKNRILSKTLKEVLLTNIVGFIAGVILGFIMSYMLAKNLWEPNGVKGCLYTNKSFVVGLFVPIFTTLFTIIPINNLINKLDPIKMIEKN